MPSRVMERAPMTVDKATVCPTTSDTAPPSSFTFPTASLCSITTCNPGLSFTRFCCTRHVSFHPGRNTITFPAWSPERFKAAGEALGAGMLLGATTLISGFPDDTCSLVALVTPACFATAAFDAAGGMAGQIVACLCPGQAHLIGSHSHAMMGPNKVHYY
jgi:hypothetical protein